MATPDVKTLLVQTLVSKLEGRASAFLQARLVRVIESSPPTRAMLDDAVKRIRVAVKLFVDEKLAQELSKILTRMIDQHMH